MSGRWQSVGGAPLIGKSQPFTGPVDPAAQVRQENLHARFVSMRDVDQAIDWLKSADFIPG